MTLHSSWHPILGLLLVLIGGRVWGEELEAEGPKLNLTSVTVKSSGDPDVVDFTLEFALIHPGSVPQDIQEQVNLPDHAVITGFEFNDGSGYRKARFTQKKLEAGPERRGNGRPWANVTVDWESIGSADISVPAFRPAGNVSLRLYASARGTYREGRLHWNFCSRDSPSQYRVSVTSPLTWARDAYECAVITSGALPLEDPEATWWTWEYEKHRWLWRVELRLPSHFQPSPPERPTSVVMVFDASRSQEHNGGLATQLAIAEAFLQHLPEAQVELITYARKATRVFGRFISATKLSEEIAHTQLSRQPLQNGSALNLGVELAFDTLQNHPGPSLVVVMADSGSPSSLSILKLIERLKQRQLTPRLHLLRPHHDTRIVHEPPAEEGELARAFAGASYSVGVSSDIHALKASLAALLSPPALQSIALPEFTRQGDLRDTMWSTENELKPGESLVWFGTTRHRPPDAISLTGWLWSEKQTFPASRDPRSDFHLSHFLASESEAMKMTVCDWEVHQLKLSRLARLGLQSGFLTPDLTLHISGVTALSADIGMGFGVYGSCRCDGSAGFGGSGVQKHEPPSDVWPLLDASILHCGFTRKAGGKVKGYLERHGNEVIDVRLRNAPTHQQTCLENALWGIMLEKLPYPERFEYTFDLDN